MKMLRSSLRLAPALLFAAAVAFWILHVPRRPLAIYKAVPADAVLLGVHRNLAGRLDGLIENNLFARLTAAAGLTRGQIEAMTSDPESRIWLDRIAADECVIAHLPRQGITGAPAWCMAAWMGSESVRLRWSLALSAAKDCRAGSIAGTRVWRFRLDDLPPGQRLYCAVEEGVLLAAVSASPAAIHRMILACQGRLDSFVDRNPDLDFPTPDELKRRPDQYWIPIKADQMLNMRFSRIDRQGISGVLGLASAGNHPPAAELPRADAIEWKQPMLHAQLTRQTVAQIGSSFSNQSWAALLLSLRSELQSGPLFIGLFGGEYQGRFKGFRIPGVLLATPVSNKDKALRLLLSRIDRLNAIHSLGIIHNRVDIADTSIYRIEGTRDNLYGKLPPEEQLAFMLRNGFLLIGSHSELLRRIALDQLLAKDNPIWKDLEEGRGGSYIQADIDRSAKALRLALAVYSLKMASADPDNSRRIRERIDIIEHWVEACIPYDDCLIWDPERDPSRYIGFELGPDLRREPR